MKVDINNGVKGEKWILS